MGRGIMECHIKAWRLESMVMGHCALFDDAHACNGTDWIMTCPYPYDPRLGGLVNNECHVEFMKRYVKGGDAT